MKHEKHIRDNIAANPNYYSLAVMENIERCKVDSDYLGDVMCVNENLIWHSVHKYVGKPENIVRKNCLEKDDILQLGRVGFIKAIKAFDTKRGVKFSSFAVIAIVREIRCFLRDSANIIRPTRTANDLINRINRVENDLGYKPSAEELTELLDEELDKVTKALQVGRPTKYLEDIIAHSEHTQTRLVDVLSEQGDLERDALDRVYIDNLLDVLRQQLNERELRVLTARIAGLSQTEVARTENISQMSVSRIMRKIASTIKDSPELTKLVGGN